MVGDCGGYKFGERRARQAKLPSGTAGSCDNPCPRARQRFDTTRGATQSKGRLRHKRACSINAKAGDNEWTHLSVVPADRPVDALVAVAATRQQVLDEGEHALELGEDEHAVAAAGRQTDKQGVAEGRKRAGE